MATRPQQPPPPPPGTVGKKLAVGGAVGFAGAGVAGLAPSAVGAAAVGAGAALSAAAIARLTGEIVGSTVAHFRARAPRSEEGIRDQLAATYPGRGAAELDGLAREEVLREREFQRRMVERLRRDLPKALAEPDADRRRAAVRSLLERERRYVEMREEAITDRAVARTERDAVKDASPQGAYWYLSPFVMKHTPDCLALGGKFWPWEFLDEVHPLLHPGCRCQLLTLEDAVRRGYMHPDQVGEPGLMAKIGRKLYQDAMAVAEAVTEEEWALWLAELAEAAPPELLDVSSFTPEKLDVLEGASLGGAMVALYPDAATRKRIADHPQADEPASKIHLTLAFLTDDASTLDGKARARIRSAVKRAAAAATPLSGEVGGIAMFSGKPGEPRPLVATASVPGLNEFRAALVKALGDDMPEERFGFTPHITMRYVPREEGPVAALPPRARLSFGDVHLVMAGERESFPLGVDLKEVYLEEGPYERRWPTGTREGGRFRPRVGGTAHEISGLKRALLRDLVPALPLTPALSRAMRRGEERDIHGRRVIVPEHRNFDRVIAGRRVVSPPGTTRVFSAPDRPGSQGKAAPARRADGRMQPAVWDRLRPHRVERDEDAARRARGAVTADDRDHPPVVEGQAAASAGRALEAAGFIETGFRDEKEGYRYSYAGPDGGELDVWYGRDGRSVSRADWRPGEARDHGHELARPPRTFEEFGGDLVAFAHRWARENGHSALTGRVVSDPGYADHAAESFPDGEMRLGEDFAPDVLAGAAARARGASPTEEQLRGLYAAAQSGHHEALHAANPMPLSLQAELENTNLDEALAEELSHVEAARALRTQGQQDVLDWAADHPWDAKRIGTYPAERAALARLLDRAGVDASGREGAVRRLLATRPAGRWAALERMGVPEEQARAEMLAPPAVNQAFEPLLAIPADPTFRPSGFAVGGEDVQGGDRVTSASGASGTVLATTRRGAVPLAAVAWDDGSVDPAVTPRDLTSAEHTPARVAGSLAPSAYVLHEGGGAEWHGGSATVVRVLRPGDDWLVEGRTPGGDPVLLTPRNTPGLRPAAPAAWPHMAPPTPAAPLEARAALAGRFDIPPGAELVPVTALVPTSRPRRRPRWPGTPAAPLEVRQRPDGRLDVLKGNELYARAVEDGLGWLPITRPPTEVPQSSPDVEPDPHAAAALADIHGRANEPTGGIEAIQARHPDVRLWADEGKRGIVLSMVKTPPELRGRGLASAALRDLTDYADERGLTIAATPGSPEGTQGPGALSKAKLREWYGRHGFVPNKGRNKDFTFQETMIRRPRGGRANNPITDRPWPWQKKQDSEKEAVDAMREWAEAVHGDAPTERTFKEKAHKKAPKTVRDDSGTVRVLGTAGGSNGARWAEGDDGTRYVVKTYRGDADRVATEALSNAVYRRLGIRVPEGGLLSFGGKPAFSSRVVDAERRRWTEPDAKLAEGFMADALLGNWDVVGLEQDNVLWDAEGPVRVDQGGTLEYRAMGSRKEFGPVPSEVWTMAGPRGQAFGSMALDDAVKRRGAARIARVLDEATIDSLVDAAPFRDEAMRERVRDSLRSRAAWMGRYAEGEETVPGPLEGEAARAAWAKAQEHLALYPEQDIALQGFVNGWEAPVNEHLRSGKGRKGAAPEVGFIVRELDSLLSHTSAPADTRVYFALPDAAAASTLAGKEVRERGYLGATLDEDAALESAGPKGAVVSLLVPAGVGGVLTHATPAENLPPEPQVLLERGLRLRVAGVRHEGSRVVLDAAAL